MKTARFLQSIKKEHLRDYCLILSGCILSALSYPLFLVPNKIAPGGLTGLSTILNYVFGLPVGAVSLLMNLPLFVIGYHSMGRVFASRSLLATILFSLLIDLLNIRPLTDDSLLGAVYGGVLLGLGLGLILRGGATTGGTDMAARMVHQKFQFITVGILLFFLDCAVILAAGLVMGAAPALYALICIFVTARVMDLVLAGFGTDKACFILSKQSEKIAQRVLAEMDRGATLLDGHGAFSGQSIRMLVSVVGRTEVTKIKKIVHEEDALAFMFITDTHETLGEGFRVLD